MKNIFIEHNISIDYFNNTLNHISNVLYFYLYDNLNNQNILKLDLRNALTTNANGEYI